MALGWARRGVLIVRLILHIGTHKTGTSALQECLRRNEGTLAKKGIHYARTARSKNANGLARLVAKSRRAEAQDFVNQHIAKARAIGADRLLISAESFYAMTIFFHRFNGNEYNDYWESESEAIELLKRLLPQDLPRKIIVFFRRQDYFLESIYRQVVKSSRAVSMTIEELRAFMSEALNYQRHMDIWNAAFPDCTVYTYEQASDNISEFFLRNVLQLENMQEFDGLDLRLNMRLSREVLEYKRLLNCMEMSPVDRRMSNLACTKLAQILTDDGRFRDFLAPESRATLLSEMERGNALLTQKFGMEPFPASSTVDWAPYPGLSAERARELAEHHARIKRSAAYQIEHFALSARQFVRQRLPMLAWIIPLARSLLPQHRRAP